MKVSKPIVNDNVNSLGQNIFGQRLKNARVMQGLSMEQLAERLDGSLSKMAVCKYEKGALKPNSSTLIAFSKALGKNPDYFFRPFSFAVDSVKFRKKSSLGAKESNSIKENVADYAERYFEIEEICALEQDFTLPLRSVVKSDADVMAAAAELRNLWNIGSDGIVNIIELLEAHGIKVLELDAVSKFDGLSTMINERFPIVVVNKHFPPERKRFTCLHELGHIILKFDSSIEEKEDERLCHLFANEMLIPSALFKQAIGEERHDISYQELKNIQKQFGISVDALMFKARYNGIISENRYKQYYIFKNQRPDFKALMEQSLYPQESSGRFKSLVYRALSDELITVSKAAGLLNTSVENVRNDFVLV